MRTIKKTTNDRLLIIELFYINNEVKLIK